MQQIHTLRCHMLKAMQLKYPRFQHQGHHSPRPDNHTIPPAEPNYNNYNTRPSPAPSSTGSNADVTQQFMTFLNETRQQAKLLEYRKELLANIPIFDGKDKKACLMWLSQCAHIAVNTKMTLKEVLVAKEDRSYLHRYRSS